MPDGVSPAAPPRAPLSTRQKVTGGLSAGAVAALVAAAVTVQAPRTAAREGTVLHSYQDQGRVWTGCNGHTQGMHAGMTFTPAQCAQLLREDLTAHTAAAVRATPTLVEQPSAMEQAGDFSLNAGDARWKNSPMAASFARRQWRAGCAAFRGFITLYRAPKPVSGQRCFRRADGVLFCEARGLVARRESERKLCLAGLKLSARAPS